MKHYGSKKGQAVVCGAVIYDNATVRGVKRDGRKDRRGTWTYQGRVFEVIERGQPFKRIWDTV
jgi:hypothetical protein